VDESKKAQATQFWTWFVQENARFRELEVPQKEDLLNELLSALHAYNDQLYFEIGRDDDDRGRELVITAEGNAEHFDAVQALVADAPSIPGWRITAFKPPMGFAFGTRYEDVELDPAACWFLPLVNQNDPKLFGLQLGVPGYDPAKIEQLENAAYIIIDTALGELIAARDVHHIEVCELPADPDADGFLELPELPEYLEWRRRQNDA
jgi:hypothetical protein